MNEVRSGEIPARLMDLARSAGSRYLAMSWVGITAGGAVGAGLAMSAALVLMGIGFLVLFARERDAGSGR